MKVIQNTILYIEDICYITVMSNREEIECPFCGHYSAKTHSTYERTFKDLPIQGKKVIVKLINRKIFCQNPDCKHTTFAERFNFLSNKAKKTTRLENEIVSLSLHCSSIAASEILKRNVVEVGKSTICNLLNNMRPSQFVLMNLICYL